jgi:polysaccharide deacetylase family protein (PEP-CTERM system associated)
MSDLFVPRIPRSADSRVSSIPNVKDTKMIGDITSDRKAKAETATDVAVLNSMSVDVEDWLQSTIDPGLPLTDRFFQSTLAVIDAFSARGIRGTFFILGLAAERAPSLVRDIVSAGHKVQSHGFGHRLVTSLTPNEFRQDLDRSKKHLEDLTGQEIFGYRAPAFSIGSGNLWALDVLVEMGFRYDSSIFPVRTRRYGLSSAPTVPHVARTPSGNSILELPVATYTAGGARIPVGGGGYFRLFPYPLLRRGVSQLNAEGHPAIIYMHPYEYDPFEFNELGYPIGRLMRLHQGLGRRGFPGKVDRMLGEYRFGTMRDVAERVSSAESHEYRDSDR